MMDQGHARFGIAGTYTLSSVLEMNRDQLGLNDHDSGKWEVGVCGHDSPGR